MKTRAVRRAPHLLLICFTVTTIAAVGLGATKLPQTRETTFYLRDRPLNLDPAGSQNNPVVWGSGSVGHPNGEFAAVFSDWDFGDSPNESRGRLAWVGRGGELTSAQPELSSHSYYENLELSLDFATSGSFALTPFMGAELYGTESATDSDVVVINGETEAILPLAVSARVGFQNQPQIAFFGSQGRLAYYESDSGDAVDNDGAIRFQRFETDGGLQLSGSSVVVNNYTSGNVLHPRLTRLEDGAQGQENLILTWASFGSPGDDSSLSSIQARRVFGNGTLLPAVQIQVNDVTTGFQLNQNAAPLPGGGFVVVWDSESSAGNDNSLTSIQARIFDSTSQPVGGQFQVNNQTTGFQYEPDVATLATGNFLVVWTNDELSIGDSDIMAREFTASGAPVANQFQVNSHDPGMQDKPSIATSGNEVLIAWQGPGSHNGDSSGLSVQMNGTFGAIFADGFESGDTTSWSP